MKPCHVAVMLGHGALCALAWGWVVGGLAVLMWGAGYYFGRWRRR